MNSFDRGHSKQHKCFYFLLVLLLSMSIIRYSFQINFSASILLLIVAFIAFLGDTDEIIAMLICCIPLYTSFNLNYALIICLVVLIIKDYKNFSVTLFFIPVFLMIIWELIHGFFYDFDVKQFAGVFLPLIVLTVFMSYRRKEFDYALVCRAFSITVLGMCIQLVGRILYVTNFNFEILLANLQRLGVETHELGALVVQGGHQNANSLGIMCVLAITATMQLRYINAWKKKDFIIVIVLMLFGALTASRTYLICLLLMALLLLFSQSGTISQKVHFMLKMSAIGIVAIIILCIVFPEQMEYFISRFTYDDITSGRNDLMYIYHQFIFSSNYVFFFGIGVQDYAEKLTQTFSIAQGVPHNAIQELVIAWGILGIILFIILGYGMIQSSKCFYRKKGLVNYIPLIIILAKGMVGQMLTSPYTMLALSFAYLSLAYDFERKESDIYREND